MMVKIQPWSNPGFSNPGRAEPNDARFDPKGRRPLLPKAPLPILPLYFRVHPVLEGLRFKAGTVYIRRRTLCLSFRRRSPTPKVGAALDRVQPQHLLVEGGSNEAAAVYCLHA